MLEQIFAAHWIWIIAGAVLAGLEIVIPGVFLLWIGIGALVTGLALLLLPDLALAWQMIIFAVAMLASIGFGFYIQRGSDLWSTANMLNRELPAMIGQRYVVMLDFQAGRGRIHVGDTSYAAIGSDDLKSGDTVQVVGIENGRLKVEKEPSRT